MIDNAVDQHAFIHVRVAFELHVPQSVTDRRVIPAAEPNADLGQGESAFVAHDPYDQETRPDEFPDARGRYDLLARDSGMEFDDGADFGQGGRGAFRLGLLRVHLVRQDAGNPERFDDRPAVQIDALRAFADENPVQKVDDPVGFAEQE